MVYTIVGDNFTISERAKVQGWLGTVCGVASLIGPFLGGFLIQSLSWYWIFFINIPFGIISIVLLDMNLKEKLENKKVKIDYLGSILNLSIVKYFVNLGIKGIKPDNIYSSTTISNNLSVVHIKNSVYSEIHVIFIIFLLLLSFIFFSHLHCQVG